MEIPIDLEKCQARFQAEVNDFTAEGEVRVGKRGRHIFKDNGSNILAVAHLDSVSNSKKYGEVELDSGLRVFSRAVDDRLGVYIILDWLPQFGCKFDILLTEGEEKGQSTAFDFETDKQYNWMIEFDRRGTDVVGYVYDDAAWAKLVRDSGAKDALGAWSDIGELEHLKCKGFNWGCGYYNEHDEWAYFYPVHTAVMMNYFLKFWRDNKDTYLEHIPRPARQPKVVTYTPGNWDRWRERFKNFRWCEKCYSYIRRDKFVKKSAMCQRCHQGKQKVERKCPDCNVTRNEWAFVKSGKCVYCAGPEIEREGWKNGGAAKPVTGQGGVMLACDACGEWVEEKELVKDGNGWDICTQCRLEERKYLGRAGWGIF